MACGGNAWTPKMHAGLAAAPQTITQLPHAVVLFEKEVQH